MTILREGVLQLEFAALTLYAIIMLAKKIKFNKLIFNLSFGLYISLVVAVCFFPIRIGVIEEDLNYNFIPFKSIIEICFNYNSNALIGVLGNIVILTPLGIFFNVYLRQFKDAIIGIVLFSVSIEVIQFMIGLLIGYQYRCVDVDDVILNCLGGIISCILFRWLFNKLQLKKYN
ncbi:MAG: VanZ family protein [Ruminococcaceae bacterium]|jgi:glycopeptide antibiotics resistance protein|nr:VanZ family protein [Oscillospiraceae bacterium]